jgi:hypothetical protein
VQSLQTHTKRDHDKKIVATCPEPNCPASDFYMLALFNKHCHWTCGICGQEINKTDNIEAHKKLHPEIGDSKSIDSNDNK